MEISEGKESVLAAIRGFLHEVEDGSRKLVVISVKDDDLSVSLLNVAFVESIHMLRFAYLEAVEKVEAALEYVEKVQH